MISKLAYLCTPIIGSVSGMEGYGGVYSEQEMRRCFAKKSQAYENAIRNLFDFRFKYVFVGAKGVGKSSIVHRILCGGYKSKKKSTTRMEVYCTDLTVKRNSCTPKDFVFPTPMPGASCRLEVWDPPSECLEHPCPLNGDAVFLVFDITNKESFDKICEYVENNDFQDERKIRSQRMISKSTVLVGNKYDVIDCDLISRQNQSSRAFGAVTGINWRTRGTIIHKSRCRKLGLMSLNRPAMLRIFEFLKEPETFVNSTGRNQEYVHPDVASEYAASIGASYYSVSAQTGHGITEFLEDTTCRLMPADQVLQVTQAPDKKTFSVLGEWKDKIMLSFNTSRPFLTEITLPKPSENQHSGGRSGFSVAMGVVSDSTMGLFKN